MVQGLLALLSEQVCAGCEGEVLRLDESGLCDSCLPRVGGLPRWFPVEAPVREAWCLGPYDGPLGAALRAAKFGPDLRRMEGLGQLLAAAAVGRLPRVDAVVPVPVPRLRRWRRGFDQGQVLAEPVARALGRPCLAVLGRRSSPPLSRGADLAARQRRARASFRARAGAPRRVLLVDDVRTTGATAAVCADELLGAGAQRVYLLSLTRRRAPEEVRAEPGADVRLP